MRRLLGRSLRKEVERRLRDAGDARLELEDIEGEPDAAADLSDIAAPQALAFMPHLFVLTFLPHRRPHGHQFERVNGWQSMRMKVPRRVGLPYGVYPRLLLMSLATEAVRKKSRQIHLGATC